MGSMDEVEGLTSEMDDKMMLHQRTIGLRIPMDWLDQRAPGNVL